MMTFLGVPVFEWAGLALALGLGFEHWWSTRKKADESSSLEKAGSEERESGTKRSG